MTSQDLSDRALRGFIDTGVLKLENAFPAETAAAARDILWRRAGLSPDEPSGWTRPIVRIGGLSDPPFIDAANTPRLHAAYDALAGRGRWQVPKGLGTFPLRFPSDEDPGDTGWHVDMSFGQHAPDFMDWRIDVTCRGRALLMLFLFTDVTENDAPTRLRLGSHRHIARALLPHGEDGLSLRELLATPEFAETDRCDEALATGAAGTVWLCHPFAVHSAQAMTGGAPRFIAQPPLVPTGPFDPTLPPSPVQIAIREACGL